MSVFWFSILTNDQQSFKCSLILKHCDDSSFPAYHEPIRVITSSQFACELNWLELCNGISAEVRARRVILFCRNFFRLSFVSYVFNWDDLLYIYYFFIPQLKYMKFIYSFYHQDDASIFKCSYFNICTKKVNIKYYYTLI